MADEIEVQMPYMRYDITLPLVEGRVPIEGVKLNPTRSAPNGTMVTVDGPVARGEFGIVDLNIGNWLGAIEAGWELIGLPVFSKRKPVYTYVICRSDRGIDTPKDLEGKRIGLRRYRISTTLWLVGLLEHRHGVDRSKLRWVVSADSLDDPHGAFAYPEAQVELAPDPKKSLVDQLLDGDVDVLMTDISDGKLFHILETDSRVKRLFPDYESEDYRLYQETGMYTPAHILALSRKLDREHPDLAGKLYRALERSKEIAYQDILDDRAGFSIPYLRERFLEARERWGDPFKYGITANKPDIDAFIQYNHEQAFTKKPMTYDEIFASSTLDT
jgi:4,5-dihydroxyphthalate decarboxylase